jgi:hypothetical protein
VRQRLAVSCLIHVQMNTDPACGNNAKSASDNHRNQTIQNGWQVYEGPGVQPVFLTKEQAMSDAQNRTCFRFGKIRILGRHSVLRRRSKAMTRVLISRASSAPDQPQFSRNAVHRAADPSRDAVSSCHSSKYLGFAASPLFAEWQDPSRHTRRR